MLDLNFFKDKKVFVTGHTGFKGSWLCKMLINSGADLTGYALSPNDDISLFNLCGLDKKMNSVYGDIRDSDSLNKAFCDSNPEIVLHLAAQPIVKESYERPHYTYETNVMGTVNILECVRESKKVRSFLNITTDKVYLNREWEWGYREDDSLDGFDPYSNSKSCSEIITHSYKNSFFADKQTAVSTARAGNVIGGGDFAKDRIIPDCIRAVINGEKIIVRNPHSVRPYQHVLEPLTAYLMLAQAQYESPDFAGYYNIGPEDADCITTGELVMLFCDKWGGAEWENRFVGGPHEANLLKLDCSKFKKKFNWKPRWNIENAIEKTVDWAKAYTLNDDMNKLMDSQIHEFLEV